MKQLQPVLSHLDDAALLLEQPAPVVAAAGERLHAVKLLLGDLVAEQTALATSDASRLHAVWTDLSVHISAASTLSTLDLHWKATAVLRRAVIATRSGLRELAESSADPAP